MKKFLKSLLIFILPIVIIAVVAEFSVRHIPTSFRYKNEWMRENGKDVEMLILGHSHAYNDINPDLFKVKAFSLANHGQMLDMDCFLFHKFISDCPNLKYVVVPISYLTFVSYTDGISNYAVHMDYKQPFYSKDSYEVFSPQFYRKVVSYLKGEDIVRCSELGMSIDKLSTVKEPDWDKSVTRNRLFTIDAPDDRIVKNRDYLKQIVATCEQRDVQVVLVTTPIWYRYYELMNKDQLNKMYSYVEDLFFQHSNVAYYDFMTDDRFSVDDFFDQDHLNGLGAERFTMLLNDTMFCR